MKTTVKKLDSIKREINIEVSGEIVKNKFDEVFNRIAKEAKVPGFRPGHAPRDILEKNFSSQAHQLVLEELIPHTYNEAIKQDELDVVELPKISEVKLDREMLIFKATVEISPEIVLGNYKGLKIDYKKVEVSPDEIKRQIDTLKETRKIDVVDDSFAKSLGYPNLPDLERAFERQTYIQKENLQRQKIESDIIEKIVKDLDFEVPQSLIKRQLEDLIRQTKLDLALKGFAPEKIDEQEKELSEKLEAEAKRQVKVYLVLTAIAKKENIPIDDHMPSKVMELLLREANWQETF